MEQIRLSNAAFEAAKQACTDRPDVGRTETPQGVEHPPGPLSVVVADLGGALGRGVYDDSVFLRPDAGSLRLSLLELVEQLLGRVLPLVRHAAAILGALVLELRIHRAHFALTALVFGLVVGSHRHF